MTHDRIRALGLAVIGTDGRRRRARPDTEGERRREGLPEIPDEFLVGGKSSRFPPLVRDEAEMLLDLCRLLGYRKAIDRLCLCGKYQWVADVLNGVLPDPRQHA